MCMVGGVGLGSERTGREGAMGRGMQEGGLQASSAAALGESRGGETEERADWGGWSEMREGTSRCLWLGEGRGGEVRNVRGLGERERSPSLLWAHTPLLLKPLK